METLSIVLTLITVAVLIASVSISWKNIREAPIRLSGAPRTNEEYDQGSIHNEKYYSGAVIQTEPEKKGFLRRFHEFEIEEKRLQQNLIETYAKNIISFLPEEITVEPEMYDPKALLKTLESSTTPEFFLHSVLNDDEYHEILTFQHERLEQIRIRFYVVKTLLNKK